MPRLRRSLRGAAPVKLTQEERFEKIISYVKDDNYSEVLRHFNMPSHILTSFRDNGSLSRKSRLETLPTDIMLNVVSLLSGNEQILAALVCKTLAAVVETSTVRKIGNITLYRLSNKDPATHLNKNAKSEAWHECGFVKPNIQPPASPHQYDFWAHNHKYVAVMAQWKDLKDLVGAYLGPKYKLCEDCHKYRLIDKKFWTAFAEYENPGITKKVAKNVPKKKGRKAAGDATSAEKVDAIVVKWYKAAEPAYMPQVCPAHELLKERGGERVLKKVEYEA